MDFEKAIDRVAATYAKRGYRVVTRPKPADLPKFARDFEVEVVGRKGRLGVLVSVKMDRDAFAADPEIQRYAETTRAHRRWRFHFVLLQGSVCQEEVPGVQEPSEEQIEKLLSGACELLGMNFVFPAITTAWAACEAAMRRRIRAKGQPAGWRSTPRQLMSELVCSGLISTDKFDRLQAARYLRNKLVHGFTSPAVESGAATFLVDLTRHLLADSHSVNPQLMPDTHRIS